MEEFLQPVQHWDGDDRTLRVPGGLRLAHVIAGLGQIGVDILATDGQGPTVEDRDQPDAVSEGTQQTEWYSPFEGIDRPPHPVARLGHHRRERVPVAFAMHAILHGQAHRQVHVDVAQPRRIHGEGIEP